MVKTDPDLDLPKHVLCVEYVELVFRKTAPKKNLAHDKRETTFATGMLKNTKRFRKVCVTFRVHVVPSVVCSVVACHFVSLVWLGLV